ncbi:hypothetical protein OPT61_g6591 [Boeremia exigua]|uniref:Uncharacterized protein n=1 Tax=Boeremia exigua TaxID=749465 RepID=A0ACC2I671_9PLEO|nr:hypothetical protein OPT61_g6591 [Boeremia exigua]
MSDLSQFERFQSLAQTASSLYLSAVLDIDSSQRLKFRAFSYIALAPHSPTGSPTVLFYQKDFRHLAATMESAKGQLALIKVWANGTSFEIDTTKSPKANFAGLAKAQGWAGGDANWQLHWEACFNEAYPFGRDGEFSACQIEVRLLQYMSDHAEDSTTPARSAPQLNMVERSHRRLSSSSGSSASSADSDFSLISAAPSIQSVNTNGSVFGGIVLGIESVKLESTKNASGPASNTEIQHPKASVTLTLSAEEVPTEVRSTVADDTRSPLNASPFWYKYSGFEPNPQAPFKHELGRLSKHLGLQTKKEKKALQIEALTAEIDFHYGAQMNTLDSWQKLCEDVGIEKVPTSIPHCRKALKSVFVNLFDLIDHRRNPGFKVQRFQSHSEFNKFTRNGHEFPRNCAKQKMFIKVLLKKI